MTWTPPDPFIDYRPDLGPSAARLNALRSGIILVEGDAAAAIAAVQAELDQEEADRAAADAAIQADVDANEAAAAAARDADLALPENVSDWGWTFLAASAATSYIMNKNSTPKQQGTLINQVVGAWLPTTDDLSAPTGYKTQFRIVALGQTNAVAPTGNTIIGLWEQTATGGGAGGYTQTMAGAFTGTQATISAVTVAGLYNVAGSWVDVSAGGTGGALTAGARYLGGVNLSAITAANSAWQGTVVLQRRRIPV